MTKRRTQHSRGSLITLHVRLWQLLDKSIKRRDLLLGPSRDVFKTSRHTTLEDSREGLSQLLLRYSMNRTGHRHDLTREVLSTTVAECLLHVRECFSSSRHERNAIPAARSSPFTGASRCEGQIGQLENGRARIFEWTSQYRWIDHLTLSWHSRISADLQVRRYRDLLSEELPYTHQCRSRCEVRLWDRES